MAILSTKKLKPNQRELLLNGGMSFVEYDAIKIKSLEFTPDSYRDPLKVEHVIVTSQNGARAVLNLEFGIEDSEFFCVGEKTTELLTKNGLNVLKTAKDGAELAHFIAGTYKNKKFTYLCGNKRRDELPIILKEAQVSCNEVVVYETHLNEQSFDQGFDAVLFFSPSGVSAFAKANYTSTPLSVRPSVLRRVCEVTSPERSQRAAMAFCIGETTATEARKYFETVVVSNATSVESTISKAVKYLR